MKVFITKYALTVGIQEAEVEHSNCPGEVVKRERFGTTSFHAKEWYMDMNEAKVRAEVMRTAKINSLEKSIKKLNEMDF